MSDKLKFLKEVFKAYQIYFTSSQTFKDMVILPIIFQKPISKKYPKLLQNITIIKYIKIAGFITLST